MCKTKRSLIGLMDGRKDNSGAEGRLTAPAELRQKTNVCGHFAS